MKKNHSRVRFSKRALAGLLLVLLGYNLSGAGNMIQVINKGVGGSNTTHGLRRFQRDVVAHKPNCLIIFFGMNDAINPRRLLTPVQFSKNLQKMIDNSRQTGIKQLLLVTVNPIITKYVIARHKKMLGQDLNAKIVAINNVIRKISTKNKIPLVDFYKIVTKHGGATEAENSLIRNTANQNSTDGVHPTPAAYKLLAGKIADLLKGKVVAGNKIVCFGDSITYGANIKGAGTIYGETYPAWLSLYLNKAIGMTLLQRPPNPIKSIKSNLLPNASFEKSANSKTPDGWKIWNASKHKGKLTIGTANAKNGKSYMSISDSGLRSPSYVMTPKLRVVAGKTYKVSYWIRGSGKVFPMISQYQGNKYLSTYVPNKKNMWKQATNEWVQYSYKITPSSKTKQFSVAFRVRGTVFIDAVSMTSNQGNKKKVSTKGKVIELKNSNVTLKFYPPAQGGGLLGIKNSRGFEFINGGTQGLLWKIVLRRIPTKPAALTEFIKLSLDPERDDSGARRDDAGTGIAEIELLSNRLQAKCVVEQKPGKLVMRWNGINIKQELAVLDVWVEIKLSRNDKFARFRVGFNNRSKKYTVFYHYAPFVEGIFPKDNNTKKDFLASPVYTGRLINDPIKNGILGKDERFQPNRSGHSMQFDAYYHNNNGLYMGCFDGEQNIKRYYVKSSSNGLSWAMVNVPNNMKAVPQQWQTPYDIVLRCFKGDWYDASQIYRKWALKQSWTAEKALIARASTPQWFKNIDEWFSWGVPNGYKLLYSPKIVDAMQGLSAGVIAFYWGKGGYFHKMNPKRFPLRQADLDYLKQAQKHNFKTMGYIQGVCWDMQTESFKKFGIERTVRDFYGRPVIWDFSKSKKEPNVCAIAFPGKKWTDLLGGTIEKMASIAKFDAAYLDSNNHAGTYMNFNPRFSNDSGGGNAYIKANRKMVRTIKQRVRKINPGFCLTAESFWEGNMAELDAYMTCNTTYQYLSKNVSAIPLAHAVYHDYSIFYSAWLGKHGLAESGAKGYLAQNGQAFVWGVKPGWNQPTFLLKYKNHEIGLSSSVKRYRAYSAGKKFLLYGTMLRPPKANKLKQVPINWYRGYSKRHWSIELPVVMHSAWRAPDGSLGLVFYNIANQPEEIKIRLTPEQLKGVSSVKTRSVWPKNLKTRTSKQSGYIVLSCTVPPQSPAVIQIN
jgi:lysophospholipase L1-like esterase